MGGGNVVFIRKYYIATLWRISKLWEEHDRPKDEQTVPRKLNASGS